jgi:hypothetical protein
MDKLHPGGLVEQRVHAHHSAVNCRPQVSHHPLAHPCDQIKSQRCEHAEQHRRSQEADEIKIGRPRILGGDAMIDELSQRDRQRQHEHGGKHQRDNGGRHHESIGAQERQQRPQRIEVFGARPVSFNVHPGMIPQLTAHRATARRKTCTVLMTWRSNIVRQPRNGCAVNRPMLLSSGGFTEPTFTIIAGI